MAVFDKNDIVDIELETGNIHRSFCCHAIGMSDNMADWFGIRVFRNGNPVDLTGASVQGFFKNPHGENIAITSSDYMYIAENVAKVCLPQICYQYDGQFVLAIKLVGGGVTGTMRIVDGKVDNTNTESPVDPTGTTVPTYQEVLAMYGQAVDAVDDVNEIKGSWGTVLGYKDIEFEKGGMFELTGIEYSNDSRSRTAFVKVIPGSKVIVCNNASPSLAVALFEFEGNTTTSSGSNERIRVTYLQEKINYFVLTAETNYVRIQINEVVSLAATDVYLINQTSVIAKDSKTYSTIAAMKADKDLTPGMYAKTLGFTAEGDLGGGLYRIEEGLTANNISIFALNNGYFASRVFDDSPVYLESVNIGNFATVSINPILEANNVHAVKCGRLTVSSALVLGDYDFEFDKITYTGDYFAIVADSMQNHRIVGNEITSVNAGGIEIITSTGHFMNNDIDVRKITAETSAVVIFPQNGKGILHNTYRFAEIVCKNYGILTHIFANTGKYSYQGEDFFEVGNINASNDEHTGTAVYFLIDPVDNMSVDGTITGITFSHLGVENSDIGVKLYCGSNVNPNSVEACIKSIYINDMRCREIYWTDTFLIAEGYIKELYIKPTSAIKLSQWLMNITSRDVMSVIDGYVMTRNPFSPVGYGLKAVRGIKYIEKTTNSPLTITGDTDFVEMQTNEDESDLFMSPLLIIDESTRGTPITINMAFYYLESAQNIMFKLPKATEQDGAVSVELVFPHHPNGLPYPTLTNLDTENDHYFSVSCLVDHDTVRMDNVYVIRDLGNA